METMDEKCYGMASFLILLNGSFVDFFHGSGCLRQGDPLSPFLFVGGLLEGFKVRDNGLMVFLLQFTGDTLIICKASLEHIMYLRCVIHCFEAVSGLKVNLQKNRMFAVGEVEQIGSLANCLDCMVGSLPTTYIGLPLGASYNSKVHWCPVVSRIQKMLAAWKGSLLSEVERLS